MISSVDYYQYKSVLQELEESHGLSATSLITLFLSPKDKPSKVASDLALKMSTAKNIKSCI